MEMSMKLCVNPILCDGYGHCAELLPELVELDEWGFPMLRAYAVGPDLLPHARRAVTACPTLALRLLRTRANQPASHR